MPDDRDERALREAEQVAAMIERLRKHIEPVGSGLVWLDEQGLNQALAEGAVAAFRAIAKRHLETARLPFTTEAEARAFMQGIADEVIAALDRSHERLHEDLHEDLEDE